MTWLGRPVVQRYVPVHDRDVWLLNIEQLLPQALRQQVHTLLLHGPAVRDSTGEVGILPGQPGPSKQGTLEVTSRAPA